MKKALSLAAVLLLVSCTGGDTPAPTASPSGPPSIDLDAVSAHDDQFAEELPERRAGSQEEFAAATYVTAHLQQAGYVVEFDSIPVADTVRSTNVVALPPSTEDPTHLVVVPYDGSGGGRAVGIFLELARALRAAVPEHSVEFAALGAEDTNVEGGELGSRRMIKLLQDRDLTPDVLFLTDARPPQDFKAYGPGADELHRLAYGRGQALTDELLTDPGATAFEAAGFETTLVGGTSERVAPVLLRFLANEGR